MKKTAALLLALAIVSSGCNQPESITSQPESSVVQRGVENTPAMASSAIVDQAEVNSEVEQFNADIERLAELATAAEEKYDFVAAAKIWGQMQQLMMNQLGREAWQSRNAELAYEIAFAKSQFNSQQISSLKKVENLQLAIQQSLQAGDVQSAYTAMRQVSQLQKQLFGNDSYVHAQSLTQLAALDAQVGQFEAAIGNLNDSLAIMKAYKLNEHPERAAVHAGLANAYMQLSKLKTAVANQKHATRITGNVWGKQSLEMAMQANQLAAIFHRAGNLTVAEDVFRRSLAIREQNLGTNHQAIGHSCLNLGVVLMDAKKLNEAQEFLDRANQIFVDQTGADSAISQRCQSKLAVVLMLRRQPDKAEQVLKGIIRSLAQDHAPDSDVLLTYQYRLSIALGRQAKYAEAEPLMKSVLQFQQQKYGDADSRTIATLQAYAMLLDRTKNEKSAAQIRSRIRQVSHVVDDNDFQRR